MLALDTLFTIDGHVVGRDYADPTLYYYLPDERVRVADEGRGLELVVYTENIADDIDFSQSADHAGAFLTLQTEPDQALRMSNGFAKASAAGSEQTYAWYRYRSLAARSLFMSSGRPTTAARAWMFQ